MNRSRIGRLAAFVALTAVLLSPSRPASGQNTFDIEMAFPNLRFTMPVDLANDGLGSLYVVEKEGKIYHFPNDSTTQDTTLFLDIRERVSEADLEAGLLSVAFHPDYAENGYFYVYYITDDPLRSRLSRFSRSDADPRRADAASEVVLMEEMQPTPKHNGGDTAFGPDGYLYVTLGDGSTGEDQFGNGQNLSTVLGTISRIDVDRASDGRPYGIPPDNPFAGNEDGYREEIYAYGFRNPWRFSIDLQTGHVWVGDVGERTWEEVDFVVKGGNYGWPVLEADECYGAETCVREGMYPPTHSYGHDVGTSVTGGYVYRGEGVPELDGKYIFADWSGRQLWALSYGGENPYESPQDVHVEQITDAERFISAFGTDASGELYMLFTFEGKVMRFVSTSHTSRDPDPLPSSVKIALSLEGPNPFTGSTEFLLRANESGPVKVSLFDVLGREVTSLLDETLAQGDDRRIRVLARSLPNGVYFVRAQSPTGSVVRKVVLSR